ncbi:hypothetical protein GCM10010922_09950 [Microbacterium sorbitolivorans]|nr:hypothetical protein GCM10010922_09950 [Microbacterium sorbitolivorans]
MFGKVAVSDALARSERAIDHGLAQLVVNDVGESFRLDVHVVISASFHKIPQTGKFVIEMILADVYARAVAGPIGLIVSGLS